MKNLLLNIIFCISTTALCGQSLQEAIKQVDNFSPLRYGAWSLCAIDVATGKNLALKNENMSLVPASSMKVVTTATALGALGANYRFKTELQYDGTIEKDVLKGNLYIKGYGDPTLGSAYMEGALNITEVLNLFTKAVKLAGITKIDGAIVGDGTYLESSTVADGVSWGDVGNYYSAGASGLNLNDNMYSVYFSRSGKSLGDKVKISKYTPEVPGLSLKSEVTLAEKGTKDKCFIFVAPYTDAGYARGTIPLGSGDFEVGGSVPDPSFFAAFQWKKNLLANKISVTGKATTQRLLGSSSKRKTFYTYSSPKLLDIVKRTNMESVNLYAEILLKTIAAKNGKDSWAQAVAIIKYYWSKRGLDTDALFMTDGSGLSRNNAVTTYFLASLLRKVHQDKKTYAGFWDSLPVSGKSGSMKYTAKAIAGKVHAKTGSMTGVRSYSGYIESKSGKIIAFSMIANNFSCSDKEMREPFETLMAALVAL